MRGDRLWTGEVVFVFARTIDGIKSLGRCELCCMRDGTVEMSIVFDFKCFLEQMLLPACRARRLDEFQRKWLGRIALPALQV